MFFFFFFQAEDGIRDRTVTGVQTCALPILGESAVVVDADVDVFVTDVVAALAFEIGAGRVVPRTALATEGPFAGAALDSAELLDVYVEELARARALVAKRLLEPEPPEPAQSEPSQDPRDRRERHPEQLGDLGRGEAETAQPHDQADPLLRRSIGHSSRRRRPIEQATLALVSVPAHPLPRAAHADAGGVGGRCQRPSLNNHPLGQPSPATPTERRVTVKPHPDLLLGAESAWQPSASKEARMDQRAQ